MNTLDELMEGKKPGEVKVQDEWWDPSMWFKPYFKTGNKWYGLEQNGCSTAHTANNNRWSLYSEPKPKITLYETLVPAADGYLTKYYPEKRENIRGAIRTGRTFEVPG